MIRLTIAYFRPIAILLLFVFLFQCCKVYSLKSTTIEDAIGPQKKYVKVVTVRGEEILFDSIYYRNDKLYGLLKESKKVDSYEIELQEDSIMQVQTFVLNKSESNRRTLMLIVIPVVTIGAFVLLVYLIGRNVTISL